VTQHICLLHDHFEEYHITNFRNQCFSHQISNSWSI